MLHRYLIKDGIVVDGTGAAAFKADVRVRDGLIAAIGPDLERQPRERVIDAAGCYVTPGFLELHNHFDAPMWWSPTMEPMPGYGVTTSVNGNCGFAAAPVHEDPSVSKEMVDIFSFFEDIPDKPFLNQLPWNWRKWSEYRASVRKNVRLPVNFAAFVGHIAIRLAVMGMDAWERAATPAEIAGMCAHLRDALDAGALGLSSNLLDHDSKDRPVPSMKADDAEWSALLDVLACYPGATLQVIVDSFMRMTVQASTDRIARLAKDFDIKVQITGIPSLKFLEPIVPQFLEAHERRKAAGEKIYLGYGVATVTTIVNFLSSLVFAQSNNYVWNEIVAAPLEDEKLALLADPAWRARARESWEKTFSHSPLAKAASIELLESETGAGPKGCSLEAFQRARDIDHPSDALADWVLENGVRSTLRLAEWPRSERMVDYLLHDTNSIGIVTDAGAHGKMFCGIGDNVVLLTKYVRDSGAISIERAIHILSGKTAAFLGFHDRGILAPGKRADLVVFNLAEIDVRKNRKIFDVPDGEGGRTYRYTRDAAPMRLTMVNGVPTFDGGEFTGYFPGEHLAPQAAPLMAAAE